MSPRPAGASPDPKSDGRAGRPWPRWAPLLLVGAVVALFLAVNLGGSSTPTTKLTFSEFTTAVGKGQVESVSLDPASGNMNGEFTAAGPAANDGAEAVTSSGPNDAFPPAVVEQMEEQDVDYTYTRQGSNPFLQALIYLLPVLLIRSEEHTSQLQSH